MNLPWVSCQVEPGVYSPLRIVCSCSRCGDVWVHDCQHPGKQSVWYARYRALHHHGAPGARSYWEGQYHRQLQDFNRSVRGW